MENSEVIVRTFLAVWSCERWGKALNCRIDGSPNCKQPIEVWSNDMVAKLRQTGQIKTTTFEQAYPHLSEWVKRHGWIEIGQIDGMPSFVMALDEGGLIWEGRRKYNTIDEALQALEKGISDWLGEQHGD